MTKRIVSVCLALTLVILLAPGRSAAAGSSGAGEYGWEEIEGEIAMRVASNGAEVSRLVVGRQYTLQFWLQDADPYSITLPVCWNPDVVTVVDPKTGEPVPGGRKRDGQTSGFRAGSKCYESGYDEMTYEPLYWNGRPVYTTSEVGEDGYPYLNSEAGHYRFFYYVNSPNAPARAQLFLEISFRVIAKGDPDFHIATRSDGAGRYDPAQPDGLTLILPNGDEEAAVVNLTDQVECPALQVMTEEEYRQSADETPDTGNRPRPQEEAEKPETAVELVQAEHLTCFPYTTAAEVSAVLKNIGGKVTADSDCIVPVSVISGAINSLSGEERSILVKMPERMIAKSEYALVFSLSNIDDMLRRDLAMLYVETPWGYVGLQTGILADQTPDGGQARLAVTPYGTGLRTVFTVDGKEIRGFSGPALRVILPYEKPEAAPPEKDELEWEASLVETLTLPVSLDVFGGKSVSYLPLSVHKLDEDHGALIFLSPSFGGFTVIESEPQQFTDLAAAAWAEPAVRELAQRLVVNGTGGGSFSPLAAVTREQFAKMLVCAFGMYEADPPAGAFTDVGADSPFYPYVASAKAAGLAGGVGGGRFGLRQPISRQDIAVMAYRGIRQLGITLPAVREKTTFLDDAQIAAYAKEAVYALYAAGILDGTGSGMFHPRATANRAAAAKIMQGIMQPLSSLL